MLTAASHEHCLYQQSLKREAKDVIYKLIIRFLEDRQMNKQKASLAFVLLYI